MKFTKENTQNPYEECFTRITEDLNQECDKLIHQNQGHRAGKTIRKCIEQFRSRQTRLFNGDPKLRKNNLLEDFITAYRWEQDSYLDMPVLCYVEEYYLKLQKAYSKLISKGSNKSTGIYRLELLDEKNFAELLLVWAEENAIEEWIRTALVKLGQDFGEIWGELANFLGSGEEGLTKRRVPKPNSLKVAIDPQVHVKFCKQLTTYFLLPDHKDLQRVLNGDVLERTLLFLGYSSQWSDLMLQLFLSGKITKDRAAIIEWTCNNFQYQDRDGDPKDFDEENMKKQINPKLKNSERIPPNRRIKVVPFPKTRTR